MAYTLFDTDTGNALESFSDEGAAFDAVRDAVVRFGLDVADPWILVTVTPSGERRVIAEGRELVARAGVIAAQ
ncbi:MAG: hypothetical protein AB7R89_05915 [Dehalococcoidia bacterium]